MSLCRIGQVSVSASRLSRVGVARLDMPSALVPVTQCKQVPLDPVMTQNARTARLALLRGMRLSCVHDIQLPKKREMPGMNYGFSFDTV
jgi:hypothetical protein